jgi:CRISPR-associated endonuclease/helicase Cas3
MHFAWLNHDCVWVLDETQLMGSGLSTSAQLQGLREALSGSGTHTMWMSATLDAQRLGTIDFRARPLDRLELDAEDLRHQVLARRLAANKPLAPAASPFDDKDPRALAAEVAAAHRAGTRTLVVVNRVRRAQALATALRKRAPGVDVRLIHSRFRPQDRREAERVALAPGFDGILVATQAVEAGVDVSAATLFTELASWSAVVQRFGRCNRYGEHAADEVAVRWVDVPDDDALPYTPEQLQFARARLATLHDVGPATLAGLHEPPAGPNLPVIRRRDVLDLFDTTPDLSGHDLDISPYVRDADDGSDAQIAWRSFPESGPPDTEPALHRDELCRVRAGEATKHLDLWRWDSLQSTWARAKAAVPGLSYLVRAEDGRYDPALGWTGSTTPPVPPVPNPNPIASDADEDDPDARLSHYVHLRVHSEDAAEAMAGLLDALGPVVPPADHALLVRAARWHDLGKAHFAFQEMLVKKFPADHPTRRGGPWAKSDRVHSGRSPRKHFRHELASALGALEQGEPDLLCYLVAAHHGKVRTAIRSRPAERPAASERLALGVVEGDELPETDLGDGLVVPATTLRLDVMDVGETDGRPTWATRVAALLETYGPFRLAYLESLVRAADWVASRKRESAGVPHA